MKYRLRMSRFSHVEDVKVNMKNTEIECTISECTISECTISEWVKVALRPSNVKRLYTDE